MRPLPELMKKHRLKIGRMIDRVVLDDLFPI